jgi:predicted SAM-dependent methyltransferase
MAGIFRLTVAMFLNAGCGTHYASGWVNTDVWENEDTRPDVRVEPGKPYPFGDNTFDAVFMSHVLEHIHWGEVPAFLNEMSRVAKPGAPMLIICPDVYKTIKLWHEGKMPWWLVESVMEHAEVAPEHLKDVEWWDGATHHWNAHEKRIEDLLNQMQFPNIENVFTLIPDGNSWNDHQIANLIWPVVGKADWQLCLRFTNKQ